MNDGRIKVLFFASLREALPQPQLELTWSQPASVAELRTAIRAQGDGWQALTDNLLAAVNQQMATDADLVAPGDEVAFFPPVTGG